MNFKSNGVLISILILICLLLVCHVSNFIYPKKSKPNKNLNSFSNLALSIPNTPVDTQYNLITYDRPNGSTVCNNVNEAEIPCSIISECAAASNAMTIPEPYELSESEWAVIYKTAYQSAGLEVLLRSLNSTDSTSNPKTTNPNSKYKPPVRSWP
jgi:hypothetical protein